jgi:DNA-binding NarL/FixJ family response regulator
MKCHSSGVKIEVLLCGSDTLQIQLLRRELERRGPYSVQSCIGALEECRQAVVRSAAEVLLLVESLECPSPVLLAWLPELLRIFPELQVILLHGGRDSDVTANALRAGVRGLLSQENGFIHSIGKCVHCVRRGELWLSNAEVLSLVDAVRKIPTPRSRGLVPETLTARQRELVGFVAEGMGNREISVQLGVSENTVKKHLTAIFAKIGVSSRVELVLSSISRVSAEYTNREIGSAPAATQFPYPNLKPTPLRGDLSDLKRGDLIALG